MLAIVDISMQEALIFAANVLLGGLLFLYKKNEKQHSTALADQKELRELSDQRWMDCETKHEETNKRFFEMHGEVQKLSGRAQAYEALTDAQKELLDTTSKLIDTLNKRELGRDTQDS